MKRPALAVRLSALAGSLLVLASAARGQPASPFSVSAAIGEQDGVPVVRVAFGVPPGHFLYAEPISVAAAPGTTLSPLSTPAPVTVMDKFTGEEKKVYPRDFELTYRIEGAADPLELTVKLQGCDETVCFFPEKRSFSLRLPAAEAVPPSEAPAPEEPAAGVSPSDAAEPAGREADWRALAARFSVGAKAEGYLGRQDFLAFLERGVGGGGAEGAGGLVGLGVLATIAVVLIGGVGLNLTPCVLPLIPVNLAIIGAGAKAGSKARGFALGAAYGLGMAVVYGALGLAVVLAGAKFGALNSSVWFNAVIAAVFVVLALAMFDVVKIDLAHFQGAVGPRRGGGRGAFVVALAMGAVAALLAGACVAPAVISVLLLAGNLYSKGNPVGLLLPFLLGFGMGLPWPFAGAGLSFLPKPGRWMVWVRNGFGVVILAMALYYGHLAWQLFRLRVDEATDDPVGALVEGLSVASEEGKPVFIDFWATWCKNCLAMEETTFKEDDVARRLADFVVVKFQAEVPGEPPARDVLDHFGAMGLPTYVVLVPRPAAE